MPDYDTQSLAAGVSDGLDQAARSYQNGKIADSIVRVNPEMLQMIGMDKNQFGGLSAGDKSSAITGAITAIGIKSRQAQAQAQAAQTQAQTENTQAQIALRKQQMADDAAVGDALKRFMSGPPPAGEGGAAPSRDALARIMPKDRFKYAVQTSGLSGEGAVRFADVLKSMNLMTDEGAAQIPPGFTPKTFEVGADGKSRTTYAKEETATIPAGFKPTAVSVAADGKMEVRYGPEEKPDKVLTAEEVSRITAMSQAENDLNSLEKMYKDLGVDWGGPVSGRLKSWTSAGANKNVAALENAINAATPNLARGVFHEVGVLTDADIKRYTNQLPSPYDTDAVRKVKFEQLRQHLQDQREETLKSLKAAGRDVKGFGTKAKFESGSRVDSIDDAVSKGAQPGDKVLLRQSDGSYIAGTLK